MPNLTVQDRTIIAALRKNTSSGGGSVVSVTGDGTTASVDNTDPSNPVVSASLALASANSYTDAQIATLPPPGIPDAPSDGKTYGRKDGAWAEAGGGGGEGTIYTDFDANPAELSPLFSRPITIPWNWTITGWRMIAGNGESGSAQVLVLRQPNLTTPPVSITGTARPTLTGSNSASGSDMTGWTTTGSAGQLITFQLLSAAGIRSLRVELLVTKS